MTLETMRTTAERLRNVPLTEVLRAIGAKHDRYDKARWHTPKGIISVTGMKFFNWYCSAGGGGAIDLVMHLYGLDFKGALAWLSHHFPSGCAVAGPDARSNPALQLPPPQIRNLPNVKHYLHTERKIDATVIDYLIHWGELYADHRANAVFIMRSTDKVPIGAELRGTGPKRWRGMAVGSHKDGGYFSIRNVCIDGIILCESAIDAISCFIMNPRYYCLSTAGARPSAAWLEPLIRQYPKVYCGFDADPAGDSTAEAMMKVYPSINRLRPQQHDWNDVLSSQA
jgi:hypothetical protein